MNIVYILHKTAEKDGSTIALVSMLQGLTRKGINPIFVMPDKNGIYTYLESQGYTTFVSPYRHNTYPHLGTINNSLLFLPRLLTRRIINHFAVVRLAHFLKDKKIDIIHTNVSINKIGYLTAKKLNIPHIYHIREYADLINQHYYPCKSNFLKQLNHNLSYSICITRGVQDYYGLRTSERSKVIYDGIMPSVQDFTLHTKQQYFLYAGRIEPSKGCTFLIEAYAKYLKESTVKYPLRLAGFISNQRYYKRLQTFIQQHQMSDYISFLGQRNDVKDLMERALATIIPSEVEGFGLCMAEAMSCGCLTIGRNTTGLKEQMDNGIASTGDEIALRVETEDELSKYLTDITEKGLNPYTPMIEKAFLTVHSLYSYETSTQAVFDFYEQVICKTTKTTL